MCISGPKQVSWPAGGGGHYGSDGESLSVCVALQRDSLQAKAPTAQFFMPQSVKDAVSHLGGGSRHETSHYESQRKWHEKNMEEPGRFSS